MFQLSDNAHESRLKEVIEKYLRNNNYSLGGTDVHAAGDLVDKLNVSGKFSNDHIRGLEMCVVLEGIGSI